MSAGLWEGSVAAPEFRKNERCFSRSEGAKRLCDGGYVHWEKRNPAPGICKALGERKRKKTRWAQELWDYRAVCLPIGSSAGDPAVRSAQGSHE